MASQRPNILLINCDDLGYGDLGCYGSRRNHTPALDRLAAEGLRLDQFYMASPVCSPSRGAMMTGCYPPRIGFGEFEGQWVLFPGQRVGLNPEEQSVARLLKAAGYRTGIVGKWHCGDQPAFLPTRHGFDMYYGIPYSNDMGRQRADDPFPPLPLMDDETVIQEQPDQAALTERYVERCIRFMREAGDQPFFLYLAHLHVHLPHYVPERFLQATRNGRYGAAVACIDWAMDALMAELDRLGLAGNTLIVFTSDNGSRADARGGSNGRLRGRKGQTWEGGMRVPCIVRWPDRVPAGVTSDNLAASIDLLPTFCALAGAEAPEKPIDGLDLSAFWQDPSGTPSPRDGFVYWHRDALEAIRDERYKLHFSKGAEPLSALYDLQADPGETTDLADRLPAVVSRLELEADGWRERLGDRRIRKTGTEIRPQGRVDDPDTLTHFDASHPYIVAEYDLQERG
ncbi:MAG: sulfatase family protein [Opitutales bacterium]